MTWIFFSIVMFVFSNVLYLLIRHAQKKEIAPAVYSVGFFIVPATLYLSLAVVTQTSLFIPFSHLLFILAAGFVWSYMGNFFSQRGILHAPNPGYSLMIQKSYAGLTTLAAVALFGAAISASKIVGIVLIIAFVAVISIEGKVGKSQPKWIWFSLLAHLAFASGSLFSKQFLNMGLQPVVYLFYINVFVTILNIAEARYKKKRFEFTKNQMLLLAGIGMGSAGFNLAMQYAYKFAPNPGYVVAFNTASIMSVTVLSALLFKDNLTKKKMVGVLGVLIGLLVIAFG